jgi:transposase
MFMREGVLEFFEGEPTRGVSGETVKQKVAAGSPRMKPIDRSQDELRTFSLEELLEEFHPTRALWEFLGGLDLSGFESGIKAVEGRPGQATLQPQLLIALWLQACMDGVGSARELSRRCETQPAYRWLCGDTAINYHTLAAFRVKRREALEQLMVEVLAALSCEGLIQLDRVAHDGTKIRAVASRGSFHRQKWVEENYQAAQAQVEAQGDPGEDPGSKRQVAARQRAKREREERLAEASKVLGELQSKKKVEEKEEVGVSTTEPDARIMKTAEKSFVPAYNAQVTTSADHGIIIQAEATQQGSDFQQLTPALEAVKETFGRIPDQTLVDGGYMSRRNIVDLAGRTDLIGPFDVDGKQAKDRMRRNGIAAEFGNEVFVYDRASNTFQCPRGCRLAANGRHEEVGKTEYHYRAQAADCGACPHKQQCCPKSEARRVTRMEESPEVIGLRRKMATAEAKAIYKMRAPVAEFPNCWLKEKFGLRRFHVRGLEKVRMELKWYVIAYNIQQWMRLIWLPRETAIA